MRLSARARLKYDSEVPGKGCGNYINVEDRGDLATCEEEHSVDILDARGIQPEPRLDSHAFELRRWPTSVADFRDDDTIHQVYYREMEDIIKESTGAERVLVFDHTIRDSDSSSDYKITVGRVHGTALRIHTDYSDRSGPERVRTLATNGGYTGVSFTEQERDEILGSDFCIVNVWRNIKEEPVQSQPLALLDPSTLEREDMLAHKMVLPDRVGENYLLKFNPKHRWYFYPFMTRDECLVFKTWESRCDRARYCFHTAFNDLVGPSGNPHLLAPPLATRTQPRRSIEIRAVAVLPRRVSNARPLQAVGAPVQMPSKL